MKSRGTTKIKRPLVLYAIVVGYMVAPIGNILLLTVMAGIPLGTILGRLFQGYGVLASIWLLTAPLAGIGLYLVLKVGWYAFLAHSSIIFVDFIAKWVARPWFYLHSIAYEHLAFLIAGNLILAVTVGYIIRKDFRAPFFHALPRGWRKSRRIPIDHLIAIKGEIRRVTEISGGGCFVAEEKLDVESGAKAPIEGASDTPKMKYQSDVVRRGAQGFGIRISRGDVRGASDISASRSVAAEQKLDFELGLKAPIEFESDTLRIKCIGEIVRHAPQGYGIRFSGLSYLKKREIERMLSKRREKRRNTNVP